jgi:hypothetical protein
LHRLEKGKDLSFPCIREQVELGDNISEHSCSCVKILINIKLKFVKNIKNTASIKNVINVCERFLGSPKILYF